MTDREMLELAARAAGLKEFTEINGRFAVRTRFTGMQDWSPWNPLTDDGEALRLAVKLDLSSFMYFSNIGGGKRREVFSPNSGHDGGKASTTEAEYHNDPYAATRRAITRAAAEIGRQMEVTT